MLLYRLGEELVGGCEVSVLTQQEINCESLLIDCTIEVNPSPSDFDVSLIHTPRCANRLRIATPLFLKLRNITLDPSKDCCLGYVDSSHVHHLDQITIAEFVGDVPTNAENDDDTIKVTTTEES
jgi:hypothetical protein